MKGFLQHIRGIRRSLFSSRLAVAVGIISIVMWVAIGFNLYRHALAIIERDYLRLYLRFIRNFANTVEMGNSSTNSNHEKIVHIINEWKRSNPIPGDESLSIFDAHCTVVYYSGDQKVIGKRMGHYEIESIYDGSKTTFMNLIKTNSEYIGIVKGQEGNDTIMIFAPLHSIGWFIGIHRSHQLVMKDATRNIVYIFWIIIFLCALFVVGSIAFLYFSFIKRSEMLRLSEARYRNLVEDQTETIVCWRLDGTITFVNNSCCIHYQKERNKFIGANLSTMVNADDMHILMKEVSSFTILNSVFTMELRIMMADGSVKWEQWVNRGIFDNKAILHEIESVGRDVTDRKETEVWLKNSLEEKDILLKEIHHRVKNNMQIISSLLELQKFTIDDKRSIELFTICQNRIRAMALVHEKLYQTGYFSSINFKDYLHDLLNETDGLHKFNKNINLILDAGDVFIGIGTAIPCGMIVNELVTNSLKHAFNGKAEGTITVTLQPINESTYMLTVKDNGVGMSEVNHAQNSKTLGYQLVHALVKQLDGTVSIATNGGTAVSITFQV